MITTRITDEKKRNIIYDFFFNPDQTLEEVAKKNDCCLNTVSRTISKHFKNKQKDDGIKILYRHVSSNI